MKPPRGWFESRPSGRQRVESGNAILIDRGIWHRYQPDPESPHQYLLQLRIAKARRLLSETSMTVQQVSAQTGFENEQYISRLFKIKTGLTPGHWRASSRIGTPTDNMWQPLFHDFDWVEGKT